MARGKDYDKKKKDMAKRTQGFKSMPKSKKAERSVRFGNYNPETTDSRVDG